MHKTNLQYSHSTLSGWGHYPLVASKSLRPEFLSKICFPHDVSITPRGYGRSYGDAALNKTGVTLLTERLNRLLHFDEHTGLLTAEAGVSIKDIIDVFVPRGWFPAVVPGTQYVSLGGCIACDVHGKNHHKVGSFGNNVDNFKLLFANDLEIPCSNHHEAQLFWATIGGMGLTGLITEASCKLIPIESAYISSQYQASVDLEDSFIKLRESEQQPYSVAWLDCMHSGKKLGRGIIFSGHHATKAELPPTITQPLALTHHRQTNIGMMLPSGILNRHLITLYNNHFYRKHKRKAGPHICGLQPFFFPLDNLKNWYRLYGKKGMLQYQFVVPEEQAFTAVKTILEETLKQKKPAFLAVLKHLGEENSGLLSFPQQGFTVALDFPLRTPGLFALLDQLDEIVLQYHGRVYLAKDARMQAQTFKAMYPHYSSWQKIKAKHDPDNRFHSSLAERLMHD